MDRIKNCWCWFNGAMMMALLFSAILNGLVYNGKLFRQSPDSVCQELAQVIKEDHDLAGLRKETPVVTQPVQLKRSK